jgi:hemerythrin-like metal-binding protein
MIDQINLFFGRMMQGEGLEAALSMIGSLSETMSRHFAEEEALMRRVGYAETAKHIESHRGFLNEFARLKRQVEAGNLHASTELFEFAANWLTKHIKLEDLQLARAAKQKAA